MRQRHISMRLDVQRRLVLAAAAAGLSLPQQPAFAQELSSKRVTWGPFKGMSDAELARLDELSKAPNIGAMLTGSSGVRVIDLVLGDGPEPGAGQRVYAHYKIWADGFRSGPVADYSFQENRPYSWVLGTPTDRIPNGIDAGIMGMREGGWRRLVVPNAFDAGIRRINYGPTGRYVGAKAPYVLRPGATAFVDVILVDGGSGRCDSILRPAGMSEKDANKRRSLLCEYAEQVY